MIKITFLKSKEKKVLLNSLKSYGIEKINAHFLMLGKNKIRIFTGNLSKKEIEKLNQFLRIDNLGLYLCNKEKGIRLSMDALHLFKEQINQKIIDLNQEQAKKFLSGKEIEIDVSLPQDFYVLRFGKDFIGMGFVSGRNVLNFIPRGRRVYSN